MSATSVFTTIQWVGVGFMFLWFLGSSMKEGMWNNAILCFNAFMAATIAWPVGFGVFGIVMATMKPDPGDPYLPLAIVMACVWLAYILSYMAISAVTDYLSPVRVTFHPVVNSIGSFIFICGIGFVLFTCSCFGFIVIGLGGGDK